MPLRYAKLWLRFATLSFRDMSEFRVDFFTSVLQHVVHQAVFVIFWRSVLGAGLGSLGHWTFPQLAVLTAFGLISTAAMQWFVGLLHLPRKVVRGELDRYLCRPISPLFALLAEEMQGLGSLQQLVSAGVILVAVCGYYGVPVQPVDALAGLGLLAVACVAVLLLQGCLGLLAFWLGDVSNLSRLLMITGEFERYPIDLFPGWLRNLLVWAVPIGLISTYPVLVLLGRRELALPALGAALALLVLWATVFIAMWRRALARYDSVGG